MRILYGNVIYSFHWIINLHEYRAGWLHPLKFPKWKFDHRRKPIWKVAVFTRLCVCYKSKKKTLEYISRTHKQRQQYYIQRRRKKLTQNILTIFCDNGWSTRWWAKRFSQGRFKQLGFRLASISQIERLCKHACRVYTGIRLSEDSYIHDAQDQVVDPICTKVEANELNTFGVESCYDQR